MSAPPVSADFKAFLGWAELAVEEADAFLKSQTGYDRFEDTISAIDGELKSDLASQMLTGVTYNHMGKVALEMAASQTDIKPFWDYRTQNKRYDAQAQLANKLALAWWMGRHVTLRFADVIKYALPMGTGYAHQVYNSDNTGFGGGYQGGDIELLPEDPRDVLPIRPGSFLSIQESAGVIIRRERTVNWIRSKYGDAASTVKADREGSVAQLNKNTRYGRLMSQLGLRSGFMENLISSLGISRSQAKSLQIPSADLYTLYINDPSVNTGREGVWMGLLNGQQTNWSYYVPSIGELYGGKVARDDGSPTSPVRLYPRKRQVIFTRSCRIYDDTSIYWHGMFPLAKLTLDPWPWSWLGKAPLKDLLPLHNEMQKVMKVMSRHIDRIKRPGIAADKNALSEKALKAIDPEQPGLKARLNPVNGKPLEMLYEPALDGFVMQYFTLLRDGMSDLAGISGVQQMIAELNQIPQMETVDKLTALGGVINTLRSLVIEAFMSEFAMMLLMNFFQFYTVAQRVAVLGNQGRTFEDFDFDPGNLIPHDALPPMPDGTPAPRGERAREFFRYFTYQTAPGSLLRSADLPEQMKYIQLARAGVIDLITLLEKLNIPNIQAPQDLPTGIIPRLQWQQANNIGMAQNPAGRKASGQQGPRLKVSESG
jgi:hypothetical protein